MSLDGRLTRRAGEPRWLTGPAARRHAHQLRAQVDAILIGAETLRKDDPRLTVRGLGRRRQPWRVVLSRSGNLPRQAKLFNDRYAKRTLVFRDQPLENVLRDLGKRQITSVLIEGGGEILGQVLDGRLADKIQIYLAPLLAGGPLLAFPGKGVATSTDALRMENVRYERLDGCISVSACCSSAEPSGRSGDQIFRS
jgi:diaminohydroxyphosphoribosylaminopyrimidine deaminase/5-amino-6-(5-phosphoribosylamino)uracil reductase